MDVSKSTRGSYENEIISTPPHEDSDDPTCSIVNSEVLCVSLQAFITLSNCQLQSLLTNDELLFSFSTESFFRDFLGFIIYVL